jgi:spore coat polysaccharide biosynthesis protein SpsF
MSASIVGIVQARMGSTRLPGKTLMDICGQPLLAHILGRVSHARHVHQLVVATTTAPVDDAIVSFCQQNGYAVFRGSENDVLDRFYQCARAHSADVIVRITADDPFKDPVVADRITEELLQNDYDYVSNTIQLTFPEGLDIEVFTFAALERAWNEATTASDREHVTPYLWLHPERFKLKNVEYEQNLSHLRWTLDTPADLAFTRAVYERLYQPDSIFLMTDMLRLLEQEPALLELNASVERFAGHKKIMQERGGLNATHQ